MSLETNNVIMIKEEFLKLQIEIMVSFINTTRSDYKW